MSGTSNSDYIDVSGADLFEHNTRQYLRAFELTLSDKSGNGEQFGDLRCSFTVERATVQTPNHAYIRIYNLSDATAKKIIKEYSNVLINAGYKGSSVPSLIFKGNAIYTIRGNNGNFSPGAPAIFSSRESPTDTFLDITAGDGSEIFNFGRLNYTLAAGASWEDTINAMVPELKKYGVTLGSHPSNKDVTWPNAPRAVTYTGSLQSVLTQVTDSVGCKWSIQLGALEIVMNTTFLSGPAVVVSSKSGLIGQPRQTMGAGIELTMLLNPYIRMNRLIKLDPATIQQVKPPVGYQQLDTTVGIDPAGEYRVVKVTHIGDTRGNDWYSQITAVPKENAGQGGATTVPTQVN